MKQQHISEYKLSQSSGIPLSTINSLFRKGNSPTIPTLEGLCKGLNITLSEFFYEHGTTMRNEDKETQQMLLKWNLLSRKQKDAIFELMDLFIEG